MLPRAARQGLLCKPGSVFKRIEVLHGAAASVASHGRPVGIHPLRPDVNFVRDGVLVLERPGIGDLRRFDGDRQAMKAALSRSHQRATEGTIQQWPGTLIRFAFTADAGDLVLHPDQQSRTLTGRLVGDYHWEDRRQPTDRHCRNVMWLRTGVV